MKKTIPAAVLGAAAIVALLAGCSTGGPDSSDPKPTATASAKAEATGKCIDGQALITTDDLKENAASIADCEQIWVLTKDAQISVKNVAKIGFEGTGNKVVFEGAQPEVQQAEDAGNSVEAK